MAATEKAAANGSTNSPAELIPIHCMYPDNMGELNTRSGWVNIPINGTTAPRLITSAMELNSVRPTMKKNWSRRRALMF
jgi:hypothetical protein